MKITCDFCGVENDKNDFKTKIMCGMEGKICLACIHMGMNIFSVDKLSKEESDQIISFQKEKQTASERKFEEDMNSGKYKYVKDDTTGIIRIEEAK